MLAPEAFAQWMSRHEHKDKLLGHVYRYHSRSDTHSINLCLLILNDLLNHCPILQKHALEGKVGYGINLVHEWPTTRKRKTLDLAIGTSTQSMMGSEALTTAAARESLRIVKIETMGEVLIACEAKSVMTEHGKSQPRVYDELSSSHEIVHQGRPDAIAAGITVVNIAETFVSPLRQKPGTPLYISKHKQPHVAQRMVTHLRGLPIREKTGEVGFDAYCTVVISCDNQTGCTLWQATPSPQLGDRDRYETLLQRISKFYEERFSSL